MAVVAKRAGVSCVARINTVLDPPCIAVRCGERCGKARVFVPCLAAELIPALEQLLKKCGGNWRTLRALELELPAFPATAARIAEASAIMLRVLLSVKVRKKVKK